MAFFKFEAVDETGKTVNGTLQAGTPSELQYILAQRGLQTVSVDGNRVAGAPQVQLQVVKHQTPRPTTSTAKNQAPIPVQIPTRRPVSVPATTAQAPSVAPTIEKTPPLSTKERIFFYSQSSSLYNSGMGGAQIFRHLGTQLPAKFHPMFTAMEAEMVAGSSIADAMEKRPLTFTPDVAAAVRAGELSGQVGVAFAHLANTATRTRALNVPLFYFFFMFPSLLMCGVGGAGLQKASLSAIKRQDEAGGSLPKVGTLFQEIGSKGTAYIIAAISIGLLFYGIVRLLYKYPFRRMRHNTGLILGPSRAKSEATERFSWALAATSRAGISPASSIHTAASSIPNMILRERALAAIGKVRENEGLASLLIRSGMLTQEQIYMVQNSEITGDVPGTLDNIMRSEEVNYEAHTNRLKLTTSAVTTIFMGVFTLFMVAFLYTMYATGIIKVLSDQ